MKYCEACHNTYPDEFTACPADQNSLRPVGVPPPGTVIRGRREVVEAVAVTRGHWNPAASPPKPPAKALPAENRFTPKQILTFVAIALALVVGVNLAYRIYLSRPKPEPLPVVSDQDLKREVQQKLASSAIFTSEKISVVVDKGVVTLAGTVREDWKRVSAANIAWAVTGVTEVKNGILLRETLQTPQPVWKSGNGMPPAAPPEAAVPAKRPYQPYQDPAARARELVAEGNYQVSQRNYDAAIKAYRAALALDGANYEAQSGLQEAQRLR
ncbi:MAG: BON domain-containing protein [Acidobacteriales bacterium]|nr:BON domain-containing protein [Terriglobales bacterium]